MNKTLKNDELFETLHHHLHNLVNKHKTLERLPRDFGLLEVPLIGSERHTLVAIGDNPLANVTELAHKLGVTKAAISQSVRKLHNDGYIKKLKDDGNKREILLSLSKKGNQVYQIHKSTWSENCSKHLSGLTEEQIENFITVAEKLSLLVGAVINSNK